MEHPAWSIFQAIELLGLALCLPAVIYRVIRWAQEHRSKALSCSAGFAVAGWTWGLCDTQPVWAVLSPELKALQASGGIGLLAVAGLLLITAGHNCQSGIPAFTTTQTAIYTQITVITFTVIAVISLSITELPADPDLYTYVTDPRHNPHRLIVATTIGHLYLILGLLYIAIQGIRHADRTPGGRGIAFIGTSCAFIAGAIALRGLIAEFFQESGHPTPIWCGAEVQAAFLATGTALAMIGLTYPPLVRRRNDHRQLRQLAVLRKALSTEFPLLNMSYTRQTGIAEKRFEWTAQIYDGLSLLTQHHPLPTTGPPPPPDLSEQAQRIAAWIHKPQPRPQITETWLHTPACLTNEQWFQLIAAHMHATTC
ncbi:hypothetical protein [Mycobacteroides abscessus]|uniref:hypothetical protein n=1 Tax=Mycobacteroides abscessus TaxID=36809 RepID=UPI000C25EFA1|nr:hypothetical protein [Mycobacteroides abscessus]